MTNEQIKWASQHHWFVTRVGKDCVIVKDKLIQNGNEVEQKLMFRNWFELRKWVEVSWLTNVSN